MWLQGSSAGSVISRRQLLHSFTPFLRHPKPEAAQLLGGRRGMGGLWPSIHPGAGVKLDGHFGLSGEWRTGAIHHSFKNQQPLSCLTTTPSLGGGLHEEKREPGCSGQPGFFGTTR